MPSARDFTTVLQDIYKLCWPYILQMWWNEFKYSFTAKTLLIQIEYIVEFLINTAPPVWNGVYQQNSMGKSFKDNIISHYCLAFADVAQ